MPEVNTVHQISVRKFDLDRFWDIICGIDHMESIVEVVVRYAICLFVVCCTFGSLTHPPFTARDFSVRGQGLPNWTIGEKCRGFL